MTPSNSIEHLFVSTVVFIFGLLIGSFLNVVIYRLPAEKSIVFPGSHCPRCDRPLRPWENIPVFSWLFLRGRCATCRSPISWRYPAIELATGGLFLAVYTMYGLTWQMGFLLVLMGLFMVIFWIDFDTMSIYDVTTVPGILIGLVYSQLITHQLWSALAASLYAVAAMLLIWGVSLLVYREEGIGGGDVLLVAMIGAWLGLSGMVLALGLGVLLGALMGLAWLFTGYVRERYWAPVFIAAFGTLVLFGCTEALWRMSFMAVGAFEAPALAPTMHVAFFAFAAMVAASIGYFYTRATRDKDAEKPSIPFGPALVLGGVISLFWGEALIRWYLAMGLS